MSISDAEAVVMQVLWDGAPREAEEVIAALAHTGWAEPTIKTLLNRLLSKGAVAAENTAANITTRRSWRASNGCNSRAKDCCSGCSAGGLHHWWRTSANAENSVRPTLRN